MYVCVPFYTVTQKGLKLGVVAQFCYPVAKPLHSIQAWKQASAAPLAVQIPN